MHEFEREGNYVKNVFNFYHRYNRKVGHLSRVDLLNAAEYNIDEATETFAELLPKS